MAREENQSDPTGTQAPRFAVVIPVYNHERTVAEVTLQAAGLGLPVFVVNDGSTDTTPERLRGIPGITVLNHSVNRGKGAALLTGFSAAAAGGADYAVTLDADGQHDPTQAHRLMDVVRTGRRAVVVGCRQGMDVPSVPWTSRFGRKFSNFWVRVSGGPPVSDSQSGYRLYPLPETLHLKARSRRFAFEVEILVLAGKKGNSYPPGPGQRGLQPRWRTDFPFPAFRGFLAKLGHVHPAHLSENHPCPT